MMNGVTPLFAFEWQDLIRGDLIWIVFVVILGVLTLIKRGLEALFGAGGRGKAPAPGRRPGEAPAERPGGRPTDESSDQPTVFEEMKRYFEILEGKQPTTTKRKPGSPADPGSHPS